MQTTHFFTITSIAKQLEQLKVYTFNPPPPKPVDPKAVIKKL